MVTVDDIQAARTRIGAAIHVTPCVPSEHFSRLLGCEVHFKLENLQRTGSFKERGALNKLLLLDAAQRARGVIAASAGNHAQGVAYHAGRLGIPATIVMPEATPLIKIASTRAYGARIVLHGANFDESLVEARRLMETEGFTFIHPFDDEAVIAGQGTLGLELLDQLPGLDAVVVAVGGGGLIGGVATAIKAAKPNVRVIGVEAATLPKMGRSRAAGHPVTLDAARTLADGIAVRRPGDRTFELVQKYVDDLVSCDDEEIANAILLLLEREKIVSEGAGAITLAALVNRKLGLTGAKVAVIISGGNIDVNLISRIIERGLVKDGRLVRLTVTIPDRPGSLAPLMQLIAQKRANVVEIHHNRTFTKAAVGDTLVELVLETRGPEHIDELLKELGDHGYVASRD